MRIVLGVEYDGSHYHGWQFQTHDPLTLQAELEQALNQIAQHPIRVICAGRTDAGVHALQQVVHFDTAAQRPLRAWTLGANTHLSPAIRVRWALERDDTFHARFSAMARRYRYLIYHHSEPTALWHQRAFWYRRPLNIAAMQKAANFLLGTHDFSTFRGAGCQAKHPICTLECLNIQQQGVWIAIDVKANRFLLHMVRNIVGSLLKVGAGEQPPEWFAEILQKADRTLAGVTAPPQGLYFIEPSYPEDFRIPVVDNYLFPLNK